LTNPEPAAPHAGGTPANLADWGTRAIGFLIDYAPVFIVGLVASGSWPLRTMAGLLGLAYWIYLGHLDGVTGQSPGKAMQGIRVVNIQGELIGSGPGIARKVAHIVDGMICGLGYLLPIVDAQRQTIADKIMSTYVVTGVEKKPFAVDLWMAPKP
jgi:uncharacterized RDD family membrane protein YckC